MAHSPSKQRDCTFYFLPRHCRNDEVYQQRSYREAKKAKHGEGSVARARSVLLSRLIAPLVSVHGVYGVASRVSARRRSNPAPSVILFITHIRVLSLISKPSFYHPLWPIPTVQRLTRPLIFNSSFSVPSPPRKKRGF